MKDDAAGFRLITFFFLSVVCLIVTPFPNMPALINVSDTEDVNVFFIKAAY